MSYKHLEKGTCKPTVAIRNGAHVTTVEPLENVISVTYNRTRVSNALERTWRRKRSYLHVDKTDTSKD